MPGGATQVGPYARDYFGCRERLDDIVVGPDLQPDDTVGRLAPRGQQDHRQLLGFGEVAGRSSADKRGQVGERAVDLTPIEFRLLLAFARVPGRVLTRQQLIDRAFDDGFDGFERNIDVHVMNLRRKLALPAGGTPAIKTVYGVGYKFEVE